MTVPTSRTNKGEAHTFLMSSENSSEQPQHISVMLSSIQSGPIGHDVTFSLRLPLPQLARK